MIEGLVGTALIVLALVVLIAPSTRSGESFFAERLGSWTPEQWYSHPGATLAGRVVLGLLWLGTGLWLALA